MRTPESANGNRRHGYWDESIAADGQDVMRRRGRRTGHQRVSSGYAKVPRPPGDSSEASEPISKPINYLSAYRTPSDTVRGGQIRTRKW